jgi:hypothetical protein
MCGIITSVTTTSTLPRCWATSAIAWLPSAAISTRWPWRDRISGVMERIPGSSSTTSTVSPLPRGATGQAQQDSIHQGGRWEERRGIPRLCPWHCAPAP